MAFIIVVEHVVIKYTSECREVCLGLNLREFYINRMTMIADLICGYWVAFNGKVLWKYVGYSFDQLLMY